MKNAEGLALRVSRTSIFINLALSAGKLLAGLLAHSGAMVSDAVHSASDVFSTMVVIIGMRAASKDSDREHPYGHERMECVAAIIGREGLLKIFSEQTQTLPVPGALALAAAFVSILVKEGMYWNTRAAAKTVNSPALMADAWHHRSDALSSVSALIGIAGARLGLPVLDPVASLVICLMIMKAAYDIFRDAMEKMVDQSAGAETEERIRQCALRHPGVLSVDLLMSRRFGSRLYIEMEISMDGDLTLRQSHAVAEQVHADVEAAFPEVKHIMIHVNPAGEQDHSSISPS